MSWIIAGMNFGVAFMGLMVKTMTLIKGGTVALVMLGGLAFCGTPAPAYEASAGSVHMAIHEQKCLADNIYWEARNQPTKGMMAVAMVTRNRVKDNRYPHSYCEVVTQGPTKPSWKDPEVWYPVRHRCQFSWYCDGKGDKIPKVDIDLYGFIQMLAFKTYHNELEDFTNGATHYHAEYVKPEWAATKTMTMQIGEHIFYRWEK